jgi:hypothetical protein
MMAGVLLTIALGIVLPWQNTEVLRVARKAALLDAIAVSDQGRDPAQRDRVRVCIERLEEVNPCRRPVADAPESKASEAAAAPAPPQSPARPLVGAAAAERVRLDARAMAAALVARARLVVVVAGALLL